MNTQKFFSRKTNLYDFVGAQYFNFALQTALQMFGAIEGDRALQESSLKCRLKELWGCLPSPITWVSPCAA